MYQKALIEIRLFAQAAQLAATTIIQMELQSSFGGASEVTIRQIADRLCQEYPQMSMLVSRSRWALESEFVSEDHPVFPGQQVALIPPVSGG